MKRRSRIACVQCRPRGDFEGALAEALPLLERAAANGADLIALPEYCGGLRTDGPKLVPPSAPESRHPVLAELRRFAAARSVWLQIGSLAVDGPGGKLLNRSFVVDGGGEITARYDKIHMFDIQLSEKEVFRESAFVAPGGRAVVTETCVGRLGLSVCYDLRFPGLYRGLAKSGAEILAIPAAFTKVTGQAHWHVLCRARAIENFCFVVASCATGPVPGGGECFGHSLIVGPWGEVLADGGEEAGVTFADIDLDEVAEARCKIPSLSHDRTYAAAAELAGSVQNAEMKDEFLGWQCRARQLAMRNEAGRPCSAMAPVACIGDGTEEIAPLVTVLSRRPGCSVAPELSHMLKSTNDPAQARESAVRFFAGSYYSQESEFSGAVAASFQPGSSMAHALASAGRCKLVFSGESKRFELDCRVDALDEDDPRRADAWLHMRLFNPSLPSKVRVLEFDPEWTG